jgi:hypothetical protein
MIPLARVPRNPPSTLSSTCATHSERVQSGSASPWFLPTSTCHDDRIPYPRSLASQVCAPRRDSSSRQPSLSGAALASAGAAPWSPLVSHHARGCGREIRWTPGRGVRQYDGHTADSERRTPKSFPQFTLSPFVVGLALRGAGLTEQDGPGHREKAGDSETQLAVERVLLGGTNHQWRDGTGAEACCV